MEVYHHPTGVSPEMMRRIGELALEMGMPDKRMAEVFIPLK
jgi:transposase